ncbi:serine/threonine-protein kinase [uncultured Jatrophihabitans sp.]|uniref:serine/threonine-protein kinase n=1 Tax=uncultured Jatrophihabitans sp. TaxID=1610747 RepID=UPI0035CA2AAF
MAEEVWRIAQRYRVLGRIGSGGMADVVRARDELLDRDVAVKVFRSLPTTPDTAMSVERQQAELRALARLNHPNLTVLYDGSIVGQDGPAYLVMELIEGGSLAEAIENGGLGIEHTAEVGAQVADALAFVHTAGMVHRDVKPANILLGTDRIADTDFGRARLTDFGIVRLVGDEPLTQADMTLGSASYLAPEQTRGSGVGPPADVYALGLSLLEALTGRRSFEGPALEAAMARLTNDPFVPNDLPQPWPGLLHAMTARDPAHRPTAAQVAKALRNTDTIAAALAVPVPALLPPPGADNTTAYLPRSAVAAAGSTTALPPTGRPPVGPPPVRALRPAEPPPPPPRRVPVWVAVLVGVIAVLALVGVILLATSDSGSGGGGASTPASTPRTTAPTTPAPETSAASSEPQDSSAPASDSAAPSNDSSPPSSTPSSSASTTPSSATSTTGASSSASSSLSIPAVVVPPGQVGKATKTKKPK